MEMNNTDQPINSPITSDQNPVSEYPAKSQKSSLPLILGVLVLLLGVGGGSYYFGTQSNNVSTNTNQNTAPTIAPTTQTLPVATPTGTNTKQTSSIPSDWTLKSSAYCAVKFPVPPNKEPYFEFIGQDTSDPQNRRFWQLRESNKADDGHTLFTNNSSLMYVADAEASGYIAGLVGVQCAPKASYSLDNIAESYAAGFGTDVGIKVKSTRTTKIWGKDVVAAKFEGGMFSDDEIYFVIAGNQVYKINKKSDSDKELVQSTTDQIFNNLQFSN
jgi:hypothetical protein